MKKELIVAIDGPSSAGKSTVGKLLAKRLGYIYIDTGAMYRAMGWKAVRDGINLEDGRAIARFCDETMVDLSLNAGGKSHVLVDGIDVTEAIRTPEMSMMASAISAKQPVRERLVELQRSLGEKGGVVLEGRDVGTVIFPNAGAKFYLDADVRERGRRRWEEMRSKGETVDLEETIEAIRRRDHNDMNRDHSPLKKADDAVLIDSTGLSVDEVIEKMAMVVRERHGDPACR
ncbi:MAG: (d)CMP kinase [Nitrospirota bacterium]|nr:(d)CMP kinase [Nitrospirota bacterium]